MSTPPHPGSGLPPAPPPARKERSPVFWILVGVAGLGLIGALAVGLENFVFSRTAKKAGVDLADFEKNPAGVTAQIMASTDPDKEIISESEDGLSAVIRQKSTGKLVTLRVDPKSKQFFIQDGVGDAGIRVDGTHVDRVDGKVHVEGAGDAPADAAIREDQNTGAVLPAWISAYPGTSLKSQFAASNDRGSTNAFTFTTSDPAEKVVDFFEQQLKDDGFDIGLRTAQAGNQVMAAADAGEHRQVLLTVSAEGSGVIRVTERK